MNSTPSPRIEALIASSCGISATHGTHHVAQIFTTRMRASLSERAKDLVAAADLGEIGRCGNEEREEEWHG